MAYLEGPRTFLSEKQYLGCEPEICESVEIATPLGDETSDNLSAEELAVISEVVPASTHPSGESAGDCFLTCLHFTNCNNPEVCCYKAQVPLSKLKGLVDEWDAKDVTDF
jgi:hypothetical protein